MSLDEGNNNYIDEASQKEWAREPDGPGKHLMKVLYTRKRSDRK